MAEALILDSEAVNALARRSERRVLAERAAAILRLAHEKRALVRVPAAVLAEVCRGVRYDSAVNQPAEQSWCARVGFDPLRCSARGTPPRPTKAILRARG